MAVKAWVRRHALRMQYCRALGNVGVDVDGLLDDGPEVLHPRAGRRLRGGMRRILAVDGDHRAHAERRRAALAVPEADRLELDACGVEIIPYVAAAVEAPAMDGAWLHDALASAPAD